MYENMNIRISIVMPVFNGIKYIKDAIQSILDQDFCEWELLIGDNCSTDGTRQYLDTLNDSRIRVFKNSNNLGIFGNLNNLIKNCRSDIVQVLCSDDRFLNGALDKVVNFMEKDPSCAISRCFAIGDRERLLKGQPDQLMADLPNKLSPNAAILAFSTFGNLVGNLSKASFRVKFINQAGGFDQNYPYAGDWEAWIRVSSKYGISLNNEELIYQRKHINQNSYLLNKNNELYSQLNKIILHLCILNSSEDILLLRRQWKIWFVQRISKIIRQISILKFDNLLMPIENLPLEIKKREVIVTYILYKLRFLK
jgi:glycosyltransferase involved in cell wall biosynthesis